MMKCPECRRRVPEEEATVLIAHSCCNRCRGFRELKDIDKELTQLDLVNEYTMLGGMSTLIFGSMVYQANTFGGLSILGAGCAMFAIALYSIFVFRETLTKEKYSSHSKGREFVSLWDDMNAPSVEEVEDLMKCPECDDDISPYELASLVAHGKCAICHEIEHDMSIGRRRLGLR